MVLQSGCERSDTICDNDHWVIHAVIQIFIILKGSFFFYGVCPPCEFKDHISYRACHLLTNVTVVTASPHPYWLTVTRLKTKYPYIFIPIYRYPISKWVKMTRLNNRVSAEKLREWPLGRHAPLIAVKLGWRQVAIWSYHYINPCLKSIIARFCNTTTGWVE